MKIENNCLKFKSEPEMYYMEESGSKPNTVRMMDANEYKQLTDCLSNTMYERTIEITNSKTGCSFKRTLLSIVKVNKYFDVPENNYMIVFSWSPFHREGDEQ